MHESNFSFIHKEQKMQKKMFIIVRKSDGGGAIIAEPNVFYDDKSAFERMNWIKREYMGTDGWQIEDSADGFTATNEGIKLEFSVLELKVHNKYRVEITLSVEVRADCRGQAKIVAEQAFDDILHNPTTPRSLNALSVCGGNVKEVKEVEISCT